MRSVWDAASVAGPPPSGPQEGMLPRSRPAMAALTDCEAGENEATREEWGGVGCADCTQLRAGTIRQAVLLCNDGRLVEDLVQQENCGGWSADGAREVLANGSAFETGRRASAMADWNGVGRGEPRAERSGGMARRVDARANAPTAMRPAAGCCKPERTFGDRLPQCSLLEGFS